MSLVSVWEMQIKQQIGKLQLDSSLEDLIQKQCDENMLEILPITMRHIFRLENLPPHHNNGSVIFFRCETSDVQSSLILRKKL
ncbi:MAG: hypothetical protein Q3M30_15885 [Candidatus Electrothrix sp. Rat3]|nr:hypothetical protein [Candidatus Electrothrix rattekaaiensis]